MQANHNEGKKMNTTQHTCGGPVFGKKTIGCPRCDELIAGAPAVKWAWAETAKHRKAQQERTLQEIRLHNCKTSRCGPVCTAFDW